MPESRQSVDDRLRSRVGNWGRWGPEDEAGALNLVQPAQVRAAIRAAADGKVVSLAQPGGPDGMVSPHRRRPARFMDRDAGDYALGARAPHGFRFAEDTVQFPTHSGTHLDALCHVWEGDDLYNGHPAGGIRSTRGAERCGADALRPVVTLGVLVDMQEHLGRPLEPGEAITAQLLRSYLDERDVRLEPGNAVLIRTGWWERGLSSEAYHRAEPGIDLAAALYLAEHDVSLVGADNYAIEQQPGTPGTSFPVHLCLLHKFGVPLLENLDLSHLSEALLQRGRSVFMLVVAPLPLQGSTAAPVCPVAVL